MVLRHRVILTCVCRGGRGVSVVGRTVLRRWGGGLGSFAGWQFCDYPSDLLRCQGMW